MNTLLQNPIMEGVNLPLFLSALGQDNPLTVYWDIDNVICDFREKAEKVDPQIFQHEAEEKARTGKVTEFWHKLNNAGGPEFWSLMQPIADRKSDLYDLAEYRDLATPCPFKIKLLTARPNYEGPDPTVLKNFHTGRRNWVTWHCREINPEKDLIICERSEKQIHAPGNILLDDYEKNCQEWRNAGGIAIHVPWKEHPFDTRGAALQAINLYRAIKQKLAEEQDQGATA